MFDIVEARPLARGIKLFVIKAPRIARKQKPGQFVIVRLDDCGERIPLTIADADPEAGTVTIVVQAIGKTTMLLSMLQAGDKILDIVGPLGKPSEIENFGTVVVVSGSVGTAMAYPTARELKRAGNNVISIVGARSKELMVLEDEVRAVSDETFVVTDDGSYGDKGLVTDKLKEIMAGAESGLRPGRRPGAHDACRRPHDRAGKNQDHGQPELHHGGRHRDVRRLPRTGRQQERVRLRRRSRIRCLARQLRSADAAQQHVSRAGAAEHRASARRILRRSSIDCAAAITRPNAPWWRRG